MKKMTGFRVGEGTQANRFLGSPVGQTGRAAVHTNSFLYARGHWGGGTEYMGVWLSGSAERRDAAAQLTLCGVLHDCLPRATRPIDGLVTRM